MSKHHFDKLTDALFDPIMKDRDIEVIKQEYRDKGQDPDQVVADGLEFIANLKNNYPELSTPMLDLGRDFIEGLPMDSLQRLYQRVQSIIKEETLKLGRSYAPAMYRNGEERTLEDLQSEVIVLLEAYQEQHR